MKKQLNLVLLIFPLVVFNYPFAFGEAIKPSKLKEVLNVSHKLKSKRIAVLQFFPLPQKVTGNRRPHERVFTGEFYSEKPHDAENIEGIFIPNDYLRMLENNFQVYSIKYGLNIKWIDNIAGIDSDDDLILIGSVLDFSVDDDVANVKMSVRIIDAKSLSTIKGAMIHKRIKRESKEPISFQEPIHTLGSLGSDFYLERYLLNLACYSSIADLLNVVNQNVR